MTAHAPSAPDPGAIPTTARSLAPDLARGGMLLLIALANVKAFLYDRPFGFRMYPSELSVPDQAVTVVQMLLVDGRAYPLFALLFGYGIMQLAWRRAAAGTPLAAVTSRVRRRGLMLVLIGAAHGVLLFPGDIAGAYGLVAVVLAGVLVARSDTTLLVVAGIGIALATISGASFGLPDPTGSTAVAPSMTEADPAAAAAARLLDWLTMGLPQALAVFGAVALGAWAGRRRFLDEPERHRPLLVKVAVAGIATAVVGGLPLALMAAQLWTPPTAVGLLAGVLHTLAGVAGGLGYAALFGLLAIRMQGRGGPGPVAGAVVASGQRSLSSYIAQSVAFVALLPAWTLGLGAEASIWQAALIGLGAWVVIVLVAAGSARGGYRGPAEVLLRRLTYGRRPA
ncbi:MAG TPA: DUF418 domain-containing protein [Pseudonocardia sp.]|nr:DUF418 domain-containing protein [Pseudonocardia sp.]